jgi:hypothetical protein
MSAPRSESIPVEELAHRDIGLRATIGRHRVMHGLAADAKAGVIALAMHFVT